jgi:hypothetical protein
VCVCVCVCVWVCVCVCVCVWVCVCVCVWCERSCARRNKAHGYLCTHLIPEHRREDLRVVFGAFEMHQRFNRLADLVVILKHETNLFMNSVQEEENEEEEVVVVEEEEEGGSGVKWANCCKWTDDPRNA